MNENETDKTEATPGVAESTGSKFYTLLVNLGVPAVAAAAIVGAIYAALVALGVLTLPGCTVSGIYDLRMTIDELEAPLASSPVDKEGK